MIKVNCSTNNTLQLSDMMPFQGKAKRRTERDIEDLMCSIRDEGLIQPLSIWHNTTNDKFFILDGHGRFEALVKLALVDPEILTQGIPIDLIDAPDEETARKMCVQCMSTYGKLSRPGVIEFTASIPDYKAPVITAINKPQRVVAPEDTCVIIKLRIAKDKVSQLTSILREVEGVEVL